MATAFYVSAETRVGGRLRKFYLEYSEMGEVVLVQNYPYREHSAEEVKILLRLASEQLPEFGLKIEAAH